MQKKLSSNKTKKEDLKMKKILKLIIAVFMILSLVSCNFEKINNNDKENNTSSNDSNKNNTSNDSHSHTYDGWTVVKQATCTEKGKEERKCNCGVKESRDISANGHSWNSATCTEPTSCSECQATNGDALGHTTDCGVCNRCGIEYYSPYQLALKELNEHYKNQQEGLSSLEASISVKENVLRSTLNSLGFSYLNSKSYYTSQLSSIQSQLSNKQTQYSYALTSGNQSKANQLQREISELSDQYSRCYQAIRLCEQQEEIDQLKYKYEQLKYSIDSDYQRKLNEIKNQYDQ